VKPSASNLPPLVYVYKASPTALFAWKIGYFIKERYQLPLVLSPLDKYTLYFIPVFIYFSAFDSLISFKMYFVMFILLRLEKQASSYAWFFPPF